MLVLSRERDEDIVISAGPTTVIVRILDIQGYKVRLGVEAPPYVCVDRREIHELKASEQAAAVCQGGRK